MVVLHRVVAVVKNRGLPVMAYLVAEDLAAPDRPNTSLLSSHEVRLAGLRTAFKESGAVGVVAGPCSAGAKGHEGKDTTPDIRRIATFSVSSPRLSSPIRLVGQGPFSAEVGPNPRQSALSVDGELIADGRVGRQ